jgi:tripartite-type tricarboxylate transporter receptor subunit TctC
VGRSARLFLCGVLAALCLAAATATAEEFPARPLRLYIGTGAGGGADAIARYYAEKLAGLAGQPVTVENKPGAGGNIATAAVAKAPADGHHILFSTSNSLTGNFYLYKDLPFAAADFAPLTTLGQSAFAAIVNAKTSPVRSIAELTDFLRRKDGAATFATATSFSLATTQLYLSLTGTTALHVPYKTTPAAANDLLGGRIDFMFADAVLAVAQAKNGEARLLAVTSSQRIGAAPDVPTLQEAGVPGYDMTAWFGAFVPAATPAETRHKLEAWLNQIARTAETRAFLLRVGADPFPGTAELLGRVQRDYSEKWRQIVARAGIEPL